MGIGMLRDRTRWRSFASSLVGPKPRRSTISPIAVLPDMFAEADEVHVSVTFTADKAHRRAVGRAMARCRPCQDRRGGLWRRQPRVHPWSIHQAGIYDHFARLPAALLVLRRLEEMARAQRSADPRRMEYPRRQPARLSARARRGGLRHAAASGPAGSSSPAASRRSPCKTIRSTCSRA